MFAANGPTYSPLSDSPFGPYPYLSTTALFSQNMPCQSLRTPSFGNNAQYGLTHLGSAEPPRQYIFPTPTSIEGGDNIHTQIDTKDTFAKDLSFLREEIRVKALRNGLVQFVFPEEDKVKFILWNTRQLDQSSNEVRDLDTTPIDRTTLAKASNVDAIFLLYQIYQSRGVRVVFELRSDSLRFRVAGVAEALQPELWWQECTVMGLLAAELRNRAVDGSMHKSVVQ